MIKALVFDFDGLILDTEKHEYNVHREIFREHDAELPLSVWGKCVGTQDVLDPYAYLEECIGRSVDRDALKALRTARFRQLIDSEDTLPGVREYLKEAVELGLKVGLASSSSRAWVTGFLDRLGIIDCFQCICTQDDVAKVKPDPELYRMAARKLGVMPHEAVAFEDSPNGAKAAKAAGLYCVAIPNSITRELQFEAVDVTLASMSEIRLPQLIEHLTREAV